MAQDILKPNIFPYKYPNIKTLKIAPASFDPKIILRELHFSLLKSHFLHWT